MKSKHEIENIINRFSVNLEQIRDFILTLEPFLLGKSEKEIKENALSLIPYFYFLSQKNNNMPKPDIEFKKFESKLKSVGIIINYDKKTNNLKGYKFNNSESFEKHKQVIENFWSSMNRPQLLFKSSLISLISTVECHFSNILHYHYNQNPESKALEAGKKFTYSELKNLKSLEDANQIIIEEQIETIIRSNFKDWLKTLKVETNIKAEYLSEEVEEELYEIFLRRNLLVHSDGKINSIYLNKVAPKYSENLNKGEQLTVDSKYLNNAINVLEIYFILISAQIWIRYEKTNKNFQTIFLIA